MPGSPEALLITGPYGAGKSLLAANLADELERRSVPFAALDLDWLAWFHPGDDPTTEERIFLANVQAVVANYRSVGITQFVLAGSVETRDQLHALAAAAGMPMRVLRLTAPPDVLERRLRADQRPADFEVARGQVVRELGAAIAERTVDSSGSIAPLVDDVLAWLGWI